MRAHARYLSYVIRHKWFVFVAGLRVGAPVWRLVIHDWSKFLPSEWFAYVRNFYGLSEDEWRKRASDRAMPAVGFIRRHAEEIAAHGWCDERNERKAAFDRAWNLHQKRQPHHWQFWLLMEDSPSEYPKYHITSPDGGVRYHGLTEYTRAYEDAPTTAEFTEAALTISGGHESDVRYRMVKRCCDAANARRPVALEMPAALAREMVADWMGAGRAITGKWEVREWYAKNRDKMVLHPQTRAYVETTLAALATPPRPVPSVPSLPGEGR